MNAKLALLCVGLVLNAATLQGCVTYKPAPLEEVPLVEHAESATRGGVRVTTAALGRKDAQKLFPVNLYKHGIQPVWLEMENRSEHRYTFFQQSIDPKYFAASSIQRN